MAVPSDPPGPFHSETVAAKSITPGYYLLPNAPVMRYSDRIRMSHVPPIYTAFAGHELLRRGAAHEVIVTVKRLAEADPTRPVLVFEDATGQQVDFDLRGSEADVVARLEPAATLGEADGRARGRGRPRLGVTAREATLLPRHWD